MARSLSSSISPGRQADLASAWRTCRGALVGVALISALVNVLYLTGSFFMLEIYDRVLPSRSIPTLLGLAVLALGLYIFQGILDVVRARVLVRLGGWLDETLRSRVYDFIIRWPLKAASSGGDGLQPLRDLDQARAFLSGLGLTALFDLPWMPIYLGICYLFHPLIGATALAGALVLITLTILADVLTRSPARQAESNTAKRNALAEASRRNAEVLRAMGMGVPLTRLWDEASGACLASQQRAADIGGSLSAISRVLRLMLQSAVLGVGAYLVIHQEATAGVIIAGSILTARALAPVELAVAHWKGFVTARQSLKRFRQWSTFFTEEEQPMALPPPSKSLAVESMSVLPPGGRRFVVQEVSFALNPGQALGIIGPSASGKSSLVRAIVGVWSPAQGTVRLDGAAIERWTPESLGQHIGYLPQDVELFAGTVAQNIARFEREPDPAAIIAAAEAANIHELILRLPDGYDTPIGDGGTYLSAGQRQRLALARALYRNPFLVVLDEPNSNLDGEGDQALTQAIMAVRARGGIVIVVAHRASALATVDQLLVLAEGRVQALGARDQIARKLFAPNPVQPVPLQAIAEGATP
ncbi:type I secretion system permease/ATPase [Bradyrhizobium australiense]|uniref:Type I secretion system permease/ATPase n=1 Tax=Bradyrhizobium australiense TaxID=2721161 RepID=A0A7Y4LTA7_9BRAD|nr:type I secretion system permease/ATPase [Bradyrhizobium australiense]NOJ38057.1 type I secretion system permease/ATPase [Bradyrhizobium australiense]